MFWEAAAVASEIGVAAAEAAAWKVEVAWSPRPRESCQSRRVRLGFVDVAATGDAVDRRVEGAAFGAASATSAVAVAMVAAADEDFEGNEEEPRGERRWERIDPGSRGRLRTMDRNGLRSGKNKS